MAIYAASASAIPAGVEWINKALSGAAPAHFLPASGVGLWGPLIVIALGAVNALAQYAQARLSAHAALCALRDLQNDMFAQLVSIDDAQLRALGSGQIIGRLTNDASVLRETLTRAASAARDLLTLVALCAVLLWYDWALFLIVIAVYALIGWPVAAIGKYLRRQSAAAQSQTGEIASLGAEAVSAGRAIRAFGLEGAARARGKATFEARRRLLDRVARLRSLNEPFIFMVGAVALAIVIAAAAARIAAGALEPAQFISFIIALLLLSQPARGLSTLNAAAQEGFGAFERMLDLIDAVPAIADRPGAADLKIGKGAISFRGVSFAYPGGGAALSDVTLEAPAGKTLALVGESGAGKSTLVNLLLRFYEPDAGAVLIDGQDIKYVRIASLRAAIAIVDQGAVLFDDTIRANIAAGRAGASLAEIEEAARAAGAHAFIAQTPGGYDAPVGEGGARLSGGERQRIAIARAFLRDAPILLMDEATAALDADSEAVVQEAMARLMAARTTLIITHRVATARNADLVAVIENGVVAEMGTHRELAARGGAYARYCALQGLPNGDATGPSPTRGAAPAR